MRASEYCGFIYHLVGKHGGQLDKLGAEIEYETEWIKAWDPVKDLDCAFGVFMQGIFESGGIRAEKDT